MSEITGSKDFVAFGDQELRAPDAQPERVVMVASDGRTVQVMAEDIPGFAERGFERVGAAEPVPEAPTRPKRTKSAPADTEEES